MARNELAAVTVTRTRLAPPEPEHDHDQVVATEPVVDRGPPTPLERRKVADRVKLMGFFAGWAGRPFTVLEAVAATRLHPARAAAQVGVLLEAGWLQLGPVSAWEQTFVRREQVRHDR